MSLALQKTQQHYKLMASTRTRNIEWETFKYRGHRYRDVHPLFPRCKVRVPTLHSGNTVSSLLQLWSSSKIRHTQCTHSLPLQSSWYVITSLRWAKTVLAWWTGESDTVQKLVGPLLVYMRPSYRVACC